MKCLWLMVVVLCMGVGHTPPSTRAWGDDTGVKKEDKKAIVLDKDKKITMEFVRIKAGKFTMGSPETEKDRQEDEKGHQVTITKEYWMQTTEVTQGQWEAVMGKNPSHFKGATLPVEQVSWEDCQEFIEKLNEKYGDQIKGLKVDLPTEAEWEYACRAGTQTRWSFGDDEEKLGEYAWYSKNSERKTHPVGQKKPNGWGLYDMHGNVLEWCRDGYVRYLDEATDPQGPDTGKSRCLRGGGWFYNGRDARSAFRSWTVPGSRNIDLGVRGVLR